MCNLWKDPEYAAQFDMVITKGKENPEHTVEINTGQNSQIFVFRSRSPQKGASAPFSEATSGKPNHIITQPRRGRNPSQSERLQDFYSILRLMAQLNDGKVPAVFRDQSGKYWKLDAALAAWAAANGPFF